MSKRVLFLSLFLTIITLSATDLLLACGLPVHPNICIIVKGRTDYDEGPDTFIVNEDEETVWIAYWDAGDLGPLASIAGISPAANFQGKDLYLLSDYVNAVGGGKLKINEIQEALGNNWQTMPDAPSNLDGPITGASWTCVGFSGSNIFGSLSAPEAFDVGATAPNPGTTYTWSVSDARWQGGAGLIELDKSAGGFRPSWDFSDHDVWIGDGAPMSSTEYEVPFTYPTPSPDEARIRVTVDAPSVTFKYISNGARWTWTEELKDASGDVKDSRNYSLQWEGKFTKQSKSTSGTQIMKGSIKVLDLSSPQHYSVDPKGQEGPVGKEVPADFQFEVLENNPFTSGLTGEFSYSTMVCDWTGVKGEKKLCETDPGHHPHPDRCDCMAYHSEKWVWKTIPLTSGSVRQIMRDGKPAYAVVTMQPSAPFEPLPWHLAEGSHGYSYETANYLAYSPLQMKCFIVAADEAGNGVAASPYGDGEANAKASETVSAGSPIDVGANLIPAPDKVYPPEGELLGQIGGEGSWGDWGVWAGVDNITDDQRPDIRVFVTDTKYGWTHLFGHADALDGKVAQYKTARGGGSASSDTNDVSPYKSGDDCAAEWVFNAECEYLDQLEMIKAKDFHPIQNIAEGAPWGLWVDEDTRLVFKVVCRDNINQWEQQDGISFSVELQDGPAGATEDGSSMGITSDGVFEYVFRDPNRGKNAVERDCSLTVATSDDRGNSRTLKIIFFVASNDLRLQTLEEERRRKQE